MTKVVQVVITKIGDDRYKLTYHGLKGVVNTREVTKEDIHHELVNDIIDVLEEI